MTLVELLNIASTGYPDNYLSNFYDSKTGEERTNAQDEYGDTLALYVVRDLIENFDPTASSHAQALEAIRIIETAIKDLQGVVDAIFLHPSEVNHDHAQGT